MCIIAAQVKSASALPSKTLLECWAGNPHGAGYMFCEGGKVVIRKAFFTLPEFESSYRDDHSRYGPDSPFVLHFRWRTHGSTSIVNTHPHSVIPDEVAMVHNGVFKIQIPKDEDISDTVAFVREHLSWRNPKQLLGDKMRRRLNHDVGKHNLIVLMRGDGAISIVNENEGLWDGDCWYSNTGYLPRTPSYYIPGDTQYGHSLWDDLTNSTTAARIKGDDPDEHDQDSLCELLEELLELERFHWDDLSDEQWKRRRVLEDYFDEMNTAEQVKALDDEFGRRVRGDC